MPLPPNDKALQEWPHEATEAMLLGVRLYRMQSSTSLHYGKWIIVEPEDETIQNTIGACRDKYGLHLTAREALDFYLTKQSQTSCRPQE